MIGSGVLGDFCCCKAAKLHRIARNQLQLSADRPSKGLVIRYTC